MWKQQIKNAWENQLCQKRRRVLRPNPRTEDWASERGPPRDMEHTLPEPSLSFVRGAADSVRAGRYRFFNSWKEQTLSACLVSRRVLSGELAPPVAHARVNVSWAQRRASAWWIEQVPMFLAWCCWENDTQSLLVSNFMVDPAIEEVRRSASVKVFELHLNIQTMEIDMEVQSERKRSEKTLTRNRANDHSPRCCLFSWKKFFERRLFSSISLWVYSSLDEMRYEKIGICHDATSTNTLMQHLDERSVLTKTNA